MEDFFLPVLSHFQNENFWTASAGALRYRVTPREEGLAAEVWEGPWRYEDSRVEETRTFPLSDEGLEELRRWLTGWRDAIGQRPRPGAGTIPCCTGDLDQAAEKPSWRRAWQS